MTLKSLTADGLDKIVDQDIAFNDSETDPNATDRTVIGLINNDYRELQEMIRRTIERLVGPIEGLSEEQLLAMSHPAIITIGAICRAAEARDLPIL